MTTASDIHADLITPLGAYMRLRAGKPAGFLLESVEKGRLGRHSLVGSGSRLVTFDEAEREVAAGRPGRRLSRLRLRRRARADGAAARRRGRPAREPLRRRRHARPLRPRGQRGRGARRRPRVGLGSGSTADVAAEPSRRMHPSPGRRGAFPTGRRTRRGVRTAKEHIRAGDAFQIVVSQRAERPTGVSALALYRSLRRINPSPYHFLLELGRPRARRLLAGDARQAGGHAREPEPDRRDDRRRARATPSSCSPPRRTGPST